MTAGTDFNAIVFPILSKGVQSVDPILKCIPSIPGGVDVDFDRKMNQNKDLFVVGNGVLDFTRIPRGSCEDFDISTLLRPQSKTDYLSWINPVHFVIPARTSESKEEKRCPSDVNDGDEWDRKWEKLLDDIFLISFPDWEKDGGRTEEEKEEMKKYRANGLLKKEWMQRFFGYCLTCHTNMEQFYCFYNALGRSGKSFILLALHCILGPYFISVDESMYQDLPNKRGAEASTPMLHR